MSRPDRDRRPSSTGGTFATNPAERYLDARQDLAEYRREARRGPLFAHAFEARITDAERRMANALGRMEREGGSYDLWGTDFDDVRIFATNARWGPLFADDGRPPK